MMVVQEILPPMNFLYMVELNPESATLLNIAVSPLFCRWSIYIFFFFSHVLGGPKEVSPGTTD